MGEANDITGASRLNPSKVDLRQSPRKWCRSNMRALNNPGYRDRNRRGARGNSATRIRSPFSLYLISKEWQRNLASDNNINGVDSGSAYVFTRSGTTWSQYAKLTAADGSAGDQFGGRVAISGNTAIIGARLVDDNVKGGESGAAYVFTGVQASNPSRSSR